MYGTARYVPIDEAHPLQPQSPYSASKIGADAIALSYYHTFEVPVTIARPFNTYGPRQSARAVIPSIISQVASGRTTIRLGDPTPTRDFNYVADTCAGLIALSEANDALGRAVNLGAGKEISIGDLVVLIGRLMGVDIEIEHDPARIRPSGSEVFRLLSDNRLATELAGHTPRVTLEEGLRRTIAWFSDPVNLAAYKPDIYNV